jgi:hypothetical protein
MHQVLAAQVKVAPESDAKVLAARVAWDGSAQVIEPPREELSVKETKPLLGNKLVLNVVQASRMVLFGATPKVKYCEKMREVGVGAALGTGVGVLVEGLDVGVEVVGVDVGVEVVGIVGILLGISVGFLLGRLLGAWLGILLVGAWEGTVGFLVGAHEGAFVGVRVGMGKVGLVGFREVGESVTVFVT